MSKHYIQAVAEDRGFQVEPFNSLSRCLCVRVASAALFSSKVLANAENMTHAELVTLCKALAEVQVYSREGLIYFPSITFDPNVEIHTRF